MATWLYDPQSHPIFPYTKASSAYSAMVQLYACSGQFLTASNMKQKKQMGDSACRYGCKVMEDMYHIFVNCGRFKALRGEAKGMIVRRVEKRVEEFKLQESHVMGLHEAAKSFFGDSNVIWPLHYSVYYLGHVPNLDPLVSRQAFSSTTMRARFLHNVHGDFHLAGIGLPSCIWGRFKRTWLDAGWANHWME
jgi:hypothetical protein